MLTIHGQHHTRVDTDRLYVPRKEGERGLVKTDGAYVMEYVESKEDPLIQTVRTHPHHTN
jgi:hypothetical protein